METDVKTGVEVQRSRNNTHTSAISNSSASKNDETVIDAVYS